MSARKLSRLAGLVFVLAAFFGGGGAYTVGVEHGTGVSVTDVEVDPPVDTSTEPPIVYDWGWQ